MQLNRKINHRLSQPARLEAQMTLVREALGRIENRQFASVASRSLQVNEFRAFSQCGEDFIVQHLDRTLNLQRDVFVEFGVETYVESNTRFLLTYNKWSGLVIDGSQDDIRFIKSDPVYWQRNLNAECAFITAENIDQVMSGNGISGEIGLLSVDIDGDDYWVWPASDVVRPVIVVAEHNARFGPDRAVTTAYDPAFVRGEAHCSILYCGELLAALHALGKAKGYALVGCNTAGNNAFFVRRDKLTPALREVTAQQADVRNQFRETRGPDAVLTFVARQDEPAVLAGLPLVTVAEF